MLLEWAIAARAGSPRRTHYERATPGIPESASSIGIIRRAKQTARVALMKEGCDSVLSVRFQDTLRRRIAREVTGADVAAVARARLAELVGRAMTRA